MKKRKIINITLISFFTLLILFVVLVLKLEVSGVNHKNSKEDYSNIMNSSINNNPLVVDIAMLGAHDAFSNSIEGKNDVDPSEVDGILTNKFAKSFAKGVFSRLSKTQISNAHTLFTKGVRYYDVRLSFHKDNLYTKHGLISDEFSVYLKDLIKKLSSNNGEFIILDLQHVYLNDRTYSDLFKYMEDVTVNNVSIMDFIYYESDKQELGSLRYNDVTLNKTKSGVIIISKADIQLSNYKHYYYDTSIRSNWHNTNSTDILFSKIEEEYLFLKNDSTYSSYFRVNQAQLSASLDQLGKTLLDWSLVRMARNSNALLIELNDFSTYLEKLPIVMVDYSDSNYNDFNLLVNQKIKEFNQNLK